MKVQRPEVRKNLRPLLCWGPSRAKEDGLFRPCESYSQFTRSAGRM